jgi:hypothetical protein
MEAGLDGGTRAISQRAGPPRGLDNRRASHGSQVLDHSSLAVTTVYLRRLEGQTDESWGKVAEAIGV